MSDYPRKRNGGVTFWGESDSAGLGYLATISVIAAASAAVGTCAARESGPHGVGIYEYTQETSSEERIVLYRLQ